MLIEAIPLSFTKFAAFPKSAFKEKYIELSAELGLTISGRGIDHDFLVSEIKTVAD